MSFTQKGKLLLSFGTKYFFLEQPAFQKEIKTVLCSCRHKNKHAENLTIYCLGTLFYRSFHKFFNNAGVAS